MRQVFRRWWFSKTPPPLSEVAVFLVGFYPTVQWVIETILDSRLGMLPTWIPLASFLDLPAIFSVGLGAGIAVGAALTLGYRGARAALQRRTSSKHRSPPSSGK